MKKLFLIVTLTVISFSGFARQPERGYRGFAEWANDVKVDIGLYGGPTDSRYYTGVAISQGYQFNPYLYVGAGLMVEQHIDAGNIENGNKMFSAPFFADVRTDLKFGKFTPFVDARIGYNFANYGGIYLSPTVGYRLSLGHKIGINIGLGYSMTGNRNYIDKIEQEIGSDTGGPGGTVISYCRKHCYNDCFAFRIGIDYLAP